MLRTLILLALLSLLAAPPARAGEEPIRHRLTASFAASTVDRLTFQASTPGFAVGYELVPHPWVVAGVAAGWQAPARIDNRGLVYDLSLAEGLVYGGVRLALDRLRAPLEGTAGEVANQLLGANELCLGAAVGVTHYMQQVRHERLRQATHPGAGVFISWNIWFMDWLGLHFRAAFLWSLTEVVPGLPGLLRKEIHLGPTFRF
ncbi:MAG: hypothetical protein FJ098_06275 [Deltaproteobacteria bacterium]|nr:hypothetical protein [Deltaproteobacteria bacterium]